MQRYIVQLKHCMHSHRIVNNETYCDCYEMCLLLLRGMKIKEYV